MYGPLFFLQTTALLTFLSLDWSDILQSWYGMVFWPSANKKPVLTNQDWKTASEMVSLYRRTMEFMEGGGHLCKDNF